MEIKVSAQHFLEVTNGMNKEKPFGYFGEQNFIIPFFEIEPDPVFWSSKISAQKVFYTKLRIMLVRLFT